ncbi:Uncharacterised protein [Vibrio cholerae]|nr:Uncharacterised protein [Vibrio cholerae]CSI46573.1 Uncharacterised protein [Vibrio cholerae]
MCSVSLTTSANIVSSTKIPKPPNIERDLTRPSCSKSRIESFNTGLSMLLVSEYCYIRHQVRSEKISKSMHS